MEEDAAKPDIAPPGSGPSCPPLSDCPSDAIPASWTVIEGGSNTSCAADCITAPTCTAGCTPLPHGSAAIADIGEGGLLRSTSSVCLGRKRSHLVRSPSAPSKAAALAPSPGCGAGHKRAPRLHGDLYDKTAETHPEAEPDRSALLYYSSSGSSSDDSCGTAVGAQLASYDTGRTNSTADSSSPSSSGKDTNRQEITQNLARFICEASLLQHDMVTFLPSQVGFRVAADPAFHSKVSLRLLLQHVKTCGTRSYVPVLAFLNQFGDPCLRQ